MVSSSLRRSLSAVGRSVLALLLGGACQNPGELPVAEKQERIDELFEGYKKKFPNAPEMTVETLKARLAAPDPPVIVDTRGDDEREVSMIAGAVSKEEFERRREELAGREVVTYCTIGYRSGLYTEKLVEAGWAAFNLRGSIVSWTHVGGPLVKDGAPTKRVHVYGRKWNLLADGYEAVW